MNPLSTPATSNTATQDERTSRSLMWLLLPLAHHWRALCAWTFVGALTSVVVAFVMPPTFTARTTLLPPQQPQSAAAAALASLGNVTGLSSALPSRSPADLYLSLLRSERLQDAVINKFDLRRVYDVDYMEDARNRLAKLVSISAGKKDGLVTIAASDRDPKRAAEIANEHVEQLRQLTTVLAVSEAQQRRAFFEQQLKATKDKLAAAQHALEGAGFNLGALRSEPRTAAESYGQLRARLTAEEVRMQSLLGNLMANTPEVQQAKAAVAALRNQLSIMENADKSDRSTSNYYVRYREYKYFETLFDLFARQFEIARLDESREGALIQVVDLARPPDKKSAPARGLLIVTGTAIALILTAAVIILRAFLRSRRNDGPAPY